MQRFTRRCGSETLPGHANAKDPPVGHCGDPGCSGGRSGRRHAHGYARRVSELDCGHGRIDRRPACSGERHVAHCETDRWLYAGDPAPRGPSLEHVKRYVELKLGMRRRRGLRRHRLLNRQRWVELIVGRLLSGPSGRHSEWDRRSSWDHGRGARDAERSESEGVFALWHHAASARR